MARKIRNKALMSKIKNKDRFFSKSASVRSWIVSPSYVAKPRVTNFLSRVTLNDTHSSFRALGALAGTLRRLSKRNRLLDSLKSKPHKPRDAFSLGAIARRKPAESSIPTYINARDGDPFAQHICKERKKRREVLFALASGAGHAKKIEVKNPPQWTAESYYVRCK